VIGFTLALLVASAVPQDTGMLDVPIYRNAAYGVALPRPFEDWVFSLGRSRQTTTVLFHPRRASLREQLWGALVLTSFEGPIPLSAVADQRVQGSWQAELGPTFRILTRDSLTVAGLPAIHVVMSGAVNHVAVDVEEYVIARSHDLVVLQFRYPRGLPRDSIAAGYERSLVGLAIQFSDRAAAPPRTTALPPTDPAERDASANRALASSPWRPRAYDARVRFDSESARAEITVRVEIVNEDVRPRDTLTLALRWPFVLEGVRSATGLALSDERAAIVAVRLPQTVEPQGATAVTVSYRLELAPPGRGRRWPAGLSISHEGVSCLVDWLPAIQPWADSAGLPLPFTRARFTARFDLPEAYTAVAAGRLAVDLTVAGRRRMTWVVDSDPAPGPAFIAGRLRRVAVRYTPLVTLRVWALEADSATLVARADSIAREASDVWRYYTQAFGRLPIGDADVVLAEVERAHVAGSTFFLSPALPADSVRVAVARVWWGETVRFVGSGARWLDAALPAWAALAFRAATEGDSVGQRLIRLAEVAGQPLAGLEAARRAVGDASFRVAIRTLFLEHRRRPAAVADLLALLGPDGSVAAIPRPDER
jgi:hypothetical protein